MDVNQRIVIDTVYGYVRKHKPRYPKELMQIIYNFYFIPISNCEIKTIGDTDIKRLQTVKVDQKVTIQNIITGYRCVYVIFSNHTYDCCGNNSFGQLGINDCNDKTTFVKNKNIKINKIFTNPSSWHTYCMDHNNNIFACGKIYDNTYNKWIQVNTQMQMDVISTAFNYTTFINNNGQLFVCGKIESGGLGLGKQTIEINYNKLTEIKVKARFIDVYCGYEHTLLLDCNGQIWSWGYGGNGRLGHDDEDNKYTPTQIKYFMDNNIKIRQICCGMSHSLVLSNTNKIYLFGRNEDYECGNNNIQNVLTPQLNEKLKNETVIDIKCGRYHNMARTPAHKYWFWGDNKYNQCLTIAEWKNVKKPSLFLFKNFVKKDQQIVDIFLGTYSTHILIGNN